MFRVIPPRPPHLVAPARMPEQQNVVLPYHAEYLLEFNPARMALIEIFRNTVERQVLSNQNKIQQVTDGPSTPVEELVIGLVLKLADNHINNLYGINGKDKAMSQIESSMALTGKEETEGLVTQFIIEVVTYVGFDHLKEYVDNTLRAIGNLSNSESIDHTAYAAIAFNLLARAYLALI